MLELIVLAVIGVVLYRRFGDRWEANRPQIQRAMGRWVVDGERVVAETRRSLPQLLEQCLSDVRSLVSDMLGVLEPRTRTRLEEGARSLVSRTTRGSAPPRPLNPVSAAGVMASPSMGTAAGAARGDRDPAFGRLQRRYLDGAITLQQYRAEARRLRDDAEPS